MGKVYTRFQTKTAQKPYLMGRGGTYLVFVCKLLSSSISRLLVPYTRQLEILVTALYSTHAMYCFSFGGEFYVSGVLR